MLWEVKTAEKKNVFQRTHFIVERDSAVAAGKLFYMEEWYRWGRCVVKSAFKPEAHENHYNIPFELNDYYVEDQECDDGCSLQFTFEDDDEWTEEEKQYILDLWEQDSWMAFEENGIYTDDCDTEYYGPLEVECIDDTPEPVEEKKPSGGWPF